MKRKIIIPILTAVAVLLATAVVILILQTRNADPAKKDNRPGVTEDQSASDSAADPKEGTENQDAVQAGTGGVSSPDVPQDAGELPVYSDNTQGQPAQGGTATTQQPAEEQTPEETTVYTDPEQSGDEYQLPIIFD